MNNAERQSKRETIPSHLLPIFFTLLDKAFCLWQSPKLGPIPHLLSDFQLSPIWRIQSKLLSMTSTVLMTWLLPILIPTFYSASFASWIIDRWMFAASSSAQGLGRAEQYASLQAVVFEKSDRPKMPCQNFCRRVRQILREEFIIKRDNEFYFLDL